MTANLIAVSLCAVCLFSQGANRGSLDDRLVGDWIGTGGDLAGERATITGVVEKQNSADDSGAFEA